jgi:phosphatidate cytidylyltransferase
MLKTRVITALLLLLVLLAVLASGSFTFFVLAAALFLLAAAWEGFRLFQMRQPSLFAVLLVGVFLLIVSQDDFSAPLMLFGLCTAIWLFRLVPSLGLGLPALNGFGNSLLGGVYGVAVLGCFVAIVVLFKQSPLYLLSVMAVVWVADIGAYFAGKAFGKRKLAPSISPGKSWEGAIGGWLAVLLLTGGSTLFPALADTFATNLRAGWGWAGFVGVMSVIVAGSVVGDLFESQLKRRAGVKDSSRLLPGHGGILDRIDALIPTLPLAVLVNAWF